MCILYVEFGTGRRRTRCRCGCFVFFFFGVCCIRIAVVIVVVAVACMYGIVVITDLINKTEKYRNACTQFAFRLLRKNLNEKDGTGKC
jgi:hypothetical protein